MELTKKRFLIFLLTLFAFLPFAILFSWPSQRLYLVACDVGEGDAILITKGFTQVLIDGGPNNKVLQCLAQNMPFWDRTIELVINTHPDKDHITGLIDVIQRYNVRQLVSNSLVVDTEVFKEFYQQIIEKKIPVYSPQKGDKIKIAGLEFKVLWPEKVIGDPAIWKQNVNNLNAAASQLFTNNFSIVLHLQYGQFDALLTGDITAKEEKEIIKDYQFQDIEVLKIPHHGSKYSTSEEFLKAVNPRVAIISVGKNPWGHPTKEVLERLSQRNIKILRTDKEKIKLNPLFNFKEDKH